jgi:hypothetical protein
MRQLTALQNLCTALAKPNQLSAPWHELNATLQREIGHKLMTVLRIDPTQQWSERIYSSQPDAFASHGRKLLGAAPQMRRVIAAGQPMIIDGEAAVRAAFPDHGQIFSLGCACVMNVPLIWHGNVLANVNLLDVEGAYSHTAANFAQVASYLCLPTLLITTS